MLTCEVLSASLFAVLALVHTPWVLLGVSVLATASGSAFGPAAGAAIAEIAGEKELTWANSLIATGANVGATAGRLASGLLVAALGPGLVFGIDALSFLASAMLISTIHVPFSARAAGREVAEQTSGGLGLRALLEHPVLRLLAAAACISTFATSFSMTAEVPLSVTLGAGPIGLGALAAAWGLGMIAGSRLAGQALHAGNEATGVLTGRAVMGVGIGLVALAPALWAAIGCYALGGLGGGFMGVAAQSLILRRAPEALRARLLAATDACRNASFGAGVLLAGGAVGVAGPHVVYACVGAGVLVGCLPLARLVRRLGGLRPLRPAMAVAA
jgi:MFS family permease